MTGTFDERQLAPTFNDFNRPQTAPEHII
jgi:hypothetical protein